jgi:sulfotransferase family protein
MIVWLASYPRSGNTFTRIVIDRLYGRGTSTVYPVDGVRERLGGELVAGERGAVSLPEARASSEVHFVKTHRRRDDDVGDVDHVIYLARDGRDAVVSFARQRAEDDAGRYRDELEALIRRHHGGTASWGQNVLSWLPPADRPAETSRLVLIRFEDLIRDPIRVVSAAVSRAAPELRMRSESTVPTFDELHQLDPQFFRRGLNGTHRDEMPADLEDLFWSYDDNRAAMLRLGHEPGRAPTSSSEIGAARPDEFRAGERSDRHD